MLSNANRKICLSTIVKKNNWIATNIPKKIYSLLVKKKGEVEERNLCTSLITFNNLSTNTILNSSNSSSLSGVGNVSDTKEKITTTEKQSIPSSPSPPPPPTGSKKKENLVILGSGWAGFRMIKKIDLEQYNVNLVTPRNHFLFTPLLPGSACGTVELRSIIEPVRRAVHHEDYHYYEGKAVAIDNENQRVICKPNYENDPNFTLPYDKLVVAIGCDVNDFGIKGVKEHTFPLKEISHARTIRQEIIKCFERAANPSTPVRVRETLLHFVIVGAGATGVEFAAECHDLIRDLSRNFPPEIMKEVSMTVIEAGSTVLSAFDSSLQKYTQKFFGRNHIKIRTNQQVKEVLSPNSLKLQDGSTIECGLIVWSAGIKPRQLEVSQGRGFPIDPKTKKIIVDDHLHVKGFENIWALGDVSLIENIPLAATAQVAQQQGLYLARHLNGEIEDSKPFVYHHMGQLAYIGNYRAISQVGAVKSGGFLSWLFWRSAYLTRLVSIRNKFNVLLNWTSTFWFGRDISRF